MQFNGGIDCVRLIVLLDDLEGLLQPKQFYDSMNGLRAGLQRRT